MFVLRRVAKWLPFVSAKRTQADEDVEAEQEESAIQEEYVYGPKEAVGLEVIYTLDYDVHPWTDQRLLEVLHRKEEDLEEKEKMITLLKGKNDKLRMFNKQTNQRLTITASTLNNTVQSMNQFKEEMELMENAIYVRETQFLQVSSEKSYFVKRLHELMREKKTLTTDLQQAKRKIYVLNGQSNSCHKVIPNNNIKVAESDRDTTTDGDTATMRTERDIVMKRYKDLSVNSRAVTKELNDITNKYHQTLQHLESFTTRNKILEEKVQTMNMYYSQVCEERNELRRLLSEKRRQLEDQVKSNTSVWSGGGNCVVTKFEETTAHSSQHQCDRDSSIPQLCVTSSFDLSVKDNTPPTDHPATSS